MNKRILYPTDEGGVAVIILAPEARRQIEVTPAIYEIVVVPATETEPETTKETVTPAVLRDETDEEFLAWVAAKDVPEGKPFKIVDVSEIPTDRLFRNAWEFTL
jgi:hypothetical protein